VGNIIAYIKSLSDKTIEESENDSTESNK